MVEGVGIYYFIGINSKNVCTKVVRGPALTGLLRVGYSVYGQ